MSATAKYATAFSLALAPVFLFIPAMVFAGMGPCTFAHPSIMVLAFLLFVGLEIAAVPRFVSAARSVGKAPLALVGIAIALFLLIFSAVFEFYFVSDFLV